VVSACPLSEDIENIVRMEDAGAGAVVMHSLFEEQIKLESERFQEVVDNTTDAFAEFSDLFRI
jgi:dihydroorotate dehydrogenase (fumarate)